MTQNWKTQYLKKGLWKRPTITWAGLYCSLSFFCDLSNTYFNAAYSCSFFFILSYILFSHIPGSISIQYLRRSSQSSFSHVFFFAVGKVGKAPFVLMPTDLKLDPIFGIILAHGRLTSQQLKLRFNNLQLPQGRQRRKNLHIKLILYDVRRLRVCTSSRKLNVCAVLT